MTALFLTAVLLHVRRWSMRVLALLLSAGLIAVHRGRSAAEVDGDVDVDMPAAVDLTGVHLVRAAVLHAGVTVLGPVLR